MTTYTPSLQFQEAASYLSNASSLSKVSDTIKLELYGLFKYLTISHAPTSPRPSIINFTGRAKWDAWKRIESMYGNEDTDAEERYLQLARELGWVEGVAQVTPLVDPPPATSSTGNEENDLWDDEETSKRYQSSGGGFGNQLSTMSSEGGEDRAIDTLHNFSVTGNVEGLRTWLQSHPTNDLDAVDEYGYTALHLACDRGHVPIVELLLTKGVNLSVKDPDGLTAMELARIAEHDNIIVMLERA